MRYTIGTTIIDKRTKTEYSGYYASGSLGLSCVLTKEDIPSILEKNHLRNYSLYIFDRIEDAEYFCRALSRSYRRDDVWDNNTIKSKKIRRFYPLKVDTPKFIFELDEKVSNTKLKVNCYGNKTDNQMILSQRAILKLK